MCDQRTAAERKSSVPFRPTSVIRVRGSGCETCVLACRVAFRRFGLAKKSRHSELGHGEENHGTQDECEAEANE